MNNYIQIGEPPSFENITMDITSNFVVGVCDICGKPATHQTWINGEIVASRCQDHPYYSNIYHSYTEKYAYKCPECGGEFNKPSLGLPNGTYVSRSCPFCGRKMEGL